MSYVVRLHGTMSQVMSTEESLVDMDPWCEACHADNGHATETDAYRCLASWYRDQANVFHSAALYAKRKAELVRPPTALEREHGMGCVEARRNQVTGALRQLYRPGTQIEGPGWIVICQPHGSVLNVESRQRGRYAMAEYDWCYDCQLFVHTTWGRSKP